jgi:glutamyl/glutaminyl-tRNA synthetase
MQTAHKSFSYNKTRLAPTPSGYLHLGNILSFTITVCLAKRTGAKTLLRIDDLDRARANKLYIQDIFDTLAFLQIPWDEGPRNADEFETDFSQITRMGLYNDALEQLAEQKLVFSCTCSRSQSPTGNCTCQNKKIPLATPNACWRLITGNAGDLSVKTYPNKTTHASLPEEMQNFVVKKKDGFPAYQLTSVIDDIFYGIDLIVRGQDLWPSTLAQHEVASALAKNAFQNIIFYHHPLLMETTHKKLSKSAGATSIKFLRESGKSAKEIYNLIGSMLGVNHKVDTWQQLGEMSVTLL